MATCVCPGANGGSICGSVHDVIGGFCVLCRKNGCQPDPHPRVGDVYHNDGIVGDVTLTGRNKRNDGWTTNNPAVGLMDSGFASGHHKLVKAGAAPALDKGAEAVDALRAERDQARSDLATERARSAGLTRALEVAREALREIRDRGTMEDEDTRIASRALAAIGAVTGGGTAFACAKCGAGFAVLHGLEVHQRSCPGGTPGAGEAPSGLQWIRDYCASRMEGALEKSARGKGASVDAQIEQASADAFRDVGEHASRLLADSAATPVAQRRPAREVPSGKRVVPIKLDPFVRAMADRWWDYGEGDDHWGVLIGALSEMLAIEADRRGEP